MIALDRVVVEKGIFAQRNLLIAARAKNCMTGRFQIPYAVPLNEIGGYIVKLTSIRSKSYIAS